MADQLIEGTTADYIKEVDESKWTKGACPPTWPFLQPTTQLESNTEMGDFNV